MINSVILMGRLTADPELRRTQNGHQIRVQFASRKHPLYGDGKYGSRFKGDIALQSAGLQLSLIHI